MFGVWFLAHQIEFECAKITNRKGARRLVRRIFRAAIVRLLSGKHLSYHCSDMLLNVLT
jgi:hypothetical protein